MRSSLTPPPSAFAKIPNGKATYSGEDTTDRTLISKR
jgi:hypothetical protein